MKILLNGGGSAPELELTMKKLDEIIDHSNPILYIPLAMDENDIPYDSCYEWFGSLLTNINVEYEMVRTFEELVEIDFNSYSAIFIGGGNTYKLLKGLKDNNIFTNIKKFIENDGVVVGCSAGAVICGRDIDIIEEMDPNDVNLKDTVGFDVMDGISIFPHYINLKSRLSEEDNKARIDKYTKSMLDFSLTKGDVIAIPEEDTIYINGSMIEIIGNKTYYIVTNGKMESYDPEFITTISRKL